MVNRWLSVATEDSGLQDGSWSWNASVRTADTGQVDLFVPQVPRLEGGKEWPASLGYRNRRVTIQKA